MRSDVSRSQGPRTLVLSTVCHSHPSERKANGEKPGSDHASWNAGPIRMLRLAQVRAATGLGKTKIYELQAEGAFPMRVKLTAHSVAWVEADVQAWLAARINASTPLMET